MSVNVCDTANASDRPFGDVDFGHGLAHFRHDFNKTDMFSDDMLAALIDRYPREYCLISTMTSAGEQTEWLNGGIDDVPGKDVLDAVRSGRFWLCLRRLDLVAPEYEGLVDAAFEQAEARDPSLKTSKRKSTILISSPNARVLYHADIPMVALWHVRGRKRVWLYDADDEQHLPDEVLERVILRETEEEIPYDPAWDDQAKAIDLEPGWVLSWPQNTPHRVDNLDGLNVSVTTDFFTPAAQRKYGVFFANALARRRLGVTPKSVKTSGTGALMKCAGALALKKLGAHQGNERQFVRSFVLDQKCLGEIVRLSPEEQAPIVQL